MVCGLRSSRVQVQCFMEWHGAPAGVFCAACAGSMPAESFLLSNFNSIRARGEFWARKVWPSSCGFQIKKFYPNLGLDDRNCPAKSKFEGGLKELKLQSSDISKAEFAWHGTKSKEAVQGICWNGLDPGKRYGQRYGIGEYCSIQAEESQPYAAATGYLIVFLLLDGPHKTAHENYRIVKNPIDGNPMFCLPVGVVDYNADEDPKLRQTASG